MKNGNFWLRLNSAILLSGLIAQAESIQLNPSADTTAFGPDPDHNLGGAETLMAGLNRRDPAPDGLARAFLRFDFAGQIPDTASITRVTLDITVTRTPSGGANSEFALRRVLREWGEGDKTGLRGKPAAEGEATFDHRFFPDQNWSEPGGAIGEDFSETVSAVTPVQGDGHYTFASTADLIADVEFWLANPESNFGWVLMSQDESTLTTARRFGSSESETPPILTIQFEPSPAPPIQIETVSVTGGEFQISWSGGQSPFKIQSQNSLEASWKEDPNAEIDQKNQTATLPSEGEKKFIRVIAE